jgi:hypothetical protein
VSSHAFELELPKDMSLIHPVFHVSQLEPNHPNSIPNRTQDPPPPVEIDGESEYEVSEIVDSRIDKRRRGDDQILYLVRWAGYEGTADELSWEPESMLDNAKEAIEDFHRRYPTKPRRR